HQALVMLAVVSSSAALLAQSWPQWGQNPQHSGAIDVVGESPDNILARVTYDPFVSQEQGENFGELLAHYQAPLTDGQDVFMSFTSGRYASCNPPGSYTPFPCGNDNWFNQVWNEKRLHWRGGGLGGAWGVGSGWGAAPGGGGEAGGVEPAG